VQADQLPGDPDTVAAGPKLADVLIALLRDSEQLPLRGPVQPSREHLRWQKKNVLLERVDADGSMHPEPFSDFPPEIARLPWRS
jgi:hypothetical protein